MRIERRGAYQVKFLYVLMASLLHNCSVHTYMYNITNWDSNQLPHDSRHDVLKGEFTDFLKFNTTLGHIYTLHFTIKTPSDWFRMAVMAQNVVLFCTLLSLHKEKTLTTNIK